MCDSLRPNPGDPTPRLPAANPRDTAELEQRVRELCDDMAGQRPTRHSHAEAFDIVVPLMEALLDDDPDGVSPSLLAELLVIAMQPSAPQAIALQIAFGRDVGEQVTLKISRLIARARQRGLSVDEYVARSRADAATPRDTTTRLFLGESRRSPDDARILRGMALLRRTVSLSPPPLRSDLLCVIAWLHWARGERGIAMTCLSEVFRVDPAHILALGLTSLITSLAKPRWLDASTASARSSRR